MASSSSSQPTLFEEVQAKRAAKKLSRASSKPKAKAKAKDADAAGARQLARRTTEESAERSIKEHWPQSSLHWRMNARDSKGIKLIDVVVEAKRSVKKDAGRLGAVFWDGLRKRYPCDGASSSLSAEAKAMPVDAKLRDAAIKSVSHDTNVRSKGPLITWVRKCTKINKKELDCLCKLLMKFKPASQPTALTAVLATMKMIVRLGLEKEHAEIISNVAHLFDRCLVLSLASWRRGRLADDRWFRTWKGPAGLVIDTSAAERVWAARKSWKAVSKDVENLISTTEIGKKLFSWAAPYVTEERLRDHADDVTAKVLDGKMVDDAALKAWWDQNRQEADQAQAWSVLEHKRTAVFTYRGHDLEVEVSSWEQELSIYLAAYLKSRFVPTKLLPLSYEVDLVAFQQENPGEVAVGILEQYAAAREYTNELIAKQPQDGRVILDLLRRQQQVRHHLRCAPLLGWIDL